MRRPLTAVALAMIVGALGAWAYGIVQAQYPPPTGNLTMRAATTAPALRSGLGISVTARDQTGAAVAGLSCSFEIVSQPGTDASVDPGPYVTDVNGAVATTLQVGDTPGNIVVGATCGELTSQVLVAAGGAGAAAPRLPATGEGPDSAGPPDWLTIALMGALGVVALAVGLRRLYRRSG